MINLPTVTRANKSKYYYDTDVTVTEFFGSAVDLGTGGNCRIDAIETDDFIYLRIEINVGTSASLGSLPMTIKTSDLPLTVPTYDANYAIPGNFGSLSIPANENQMFAPAMNNISGFGNCIVFFNQYGAAFTDYLMGASSSPAVVDGCKYTGSMFIPKMTVGS